jgi:hypothetical protein
MSDIVVDFVNEKTGEHIKISGKETTFLLRHSDLLRNLVEMFPGDKFFKISIQNFPYGRTEIFKKILRGQPVGKYIYNHGKKEVEWYPLAKEEEELIAKNLKKGTLQSTLQKERERVLYEILSFLMLDPSVEKEFLKIKNLNNFNKERLRRKNITRKRIEATERNLYTQLANNNYYHNIKREAERITIPYLNEDTIENLVEKHKNYLYGTYAPSNRLELIKLLNKNNIEKRNKIQNARKEKMLSNLYKQEKNITRRRRMPRGRYNNNNNDRLEEEEKRLQEEFNNARHDPLYFYNSGPYNTENILRQNLAPFREDPLNNYYYREERLPKMTTEQFERYLRSLRKEGEEKGLPYQGPLVGNLYGNANNI